MDTLRTASRVYNRAAKSNNASLIRPNGSKADLVYKIVSEIPSGKVMTYGQIARIAGVKNPRYIGYLLHHNPDPEHIPCHRVVNFQGKLSDAFAFGGYWEQAKRLEAEGVAVKGDKENMVELDRYQAA